MKIFAIIILMALSLFGLEPYKKIISKNIISSISIYKNILYVSTNNGVVEIYDIKSSKLLGEIKLEHIKDYFDNLMPPRIFQTNSIDGKHILLLSQGDGGSTKLSLYNNKMLEDIKLDIDSIIKKAYFIDNDKILLGFLSNEILAYSLKERRILWRQKPSDAVFSDLILGENEAYSTTEGGVIYILDLANGNIKRVLRGANFDNIYMLASTKDIILSSGRDKICGIYNKNNGKFDRLTTDFLSYAVGISKDSRVGAVSYNESNDILVFNTRTLEKISMLTGGDALPNSIIFIDDKNIVASFDSKSILFWNIGER